MLFKIELIERGKDYSFDGSTEIFTTNLPDIAFIEFMKAVLDTRKGYKRTEEVALYLDGKEITRLEKGDLPYKNLSNIQKQMGLI
jgi:hypothetical protein